MQKYMLIWILAFLLLDCQSASDHSKVQPLIDLQTKSEGVSIFGENIISTSMYERDLAINPQGNEMIYTLGDFKQAKRCLVIMKNEEGIWQNPEILNISGKYQDIEPFYANDGNRLYFASNRPIYDDSTRSDYNIWYSDKIEKAWSAPVALDSLINTKGDEFYPSLSEKGNLYFTATRKNGIGREDIFMAEFVAGKFKSPEPLPQEINSPVYEFNAYISPKEDLIIFSAYGRADDMGGGDLYMSHKNADGVWTKSVNMGALINSEKLDYCPFIDWNSRNFYFTSERMRTHESVLNNIEDLKRLANASQNGFGDIYAIGLGQLNLN